MKNWREKDDLTVYCLVRYIATLTKIHIIKHWIFKQVLNPSNNISVNLLLRPGQIELRGDLVFVIAKTEYWNVFSYTTYNPCTINRAPFHVILDIIINLAYEERVFRESGLHFFLGAH